MPDSFIRHLNRWIFRALKGLLLLLVLVLLAWVLNLARRPPRSETRETLFQGVTYTRLVRSVPRRLVIHAVEVDLAAPGVRVLVTPGDSGCGMETCAMTTGQFLEEHGLQLAVNGSFFLPFSVGNTFWDFYPQTNDPTDVQGLAISDGIAYSDDAQDFAKICFTAAGAQITEGPCPAGTLQTIAGGAMLVREGAPERFDFADNFHPRTAVAVGEGGKRLWLIVVDGRQDGYSEGVDLNELAVLIAELGATEALNLDGGGSTTLVTAKNGPRLLNAPIHTRLPMRQRPVANHLGIYALPLP